MNESTDILQNVMTKARTNTGADKMAESKSRWNIWHCLSVPVCSESDVSGWVCRSLTEWSWEITCLPEAPPIPSLVYWYWIKSGVGKRPIFICNTAYAAHQLHHPLVQVWAKAHATPENGREGAPEGLDYNLRLLASGSNYYYLMYLQSSLCKIVSKLLILL